MIDWADFEKVEIRVGTVIRAEEFPEARKPAYKLWIDFGEHGTLKTSAQVTRLYHRSDLIGKQLVAVVNFPPKQIANFMSECLVLGALGEHGEVSLLSLLSRARNGSRVL